MKYLSSSRVRPVAPLIALTLLLASLVADSYAQGIALPDIGSPSGNLLSPAEEKRLGQAFMRSVRGSMRVIDQPLMSAYIQSIGNHLVSNSNAQGRTFYFFLVDSPQVNAFAGPGGYIGINTGLVTTTESESELASVIAHEIAHVTQNHLVRTFDAVRQMSMPATALAIAALVLGAASGNTEAGLAAATGLQAGVAQRQINFTRAHEEEADSIGIKALAESDFDPQAMAAFFGRMGKATRLYDSGQLPEYLRTHPISSNRLADAQARADQYPYRQTPDSLHYHLLRSTLQVLEFKTPKEAVEHFHDTLRDRRFRNEDGQRYGYVLALIADEQYAEAAKQLKILARKNPEEIAYIATEALLLKKSGQPEKGLQVLRDGLDLYPGNYPLSVYYAQALLDEGLAADALKLVEQQLRGRPDDGQLNKLAARAAGDSGQNNLAHQYMAEYYYQSGALEPAIQQLEIALREKGISEFRSAQMTARLDLMNEEMEELKQRNN